MPFRVVKKVQTDVEKNGKVMPDGYAR